MQPANRGRSPVVSNTCESVQYRGDFFIMNNNGTLTLGNPEGKIHELLGQQLNQTKTSI